MPLVLERNLRLIDFIRFSIPYISDLGACDISGILFGLLRIIEFMAHIEYNKRYSVIGNSFDMATV